MLLVYIRIVMNLLYFNNSHLPIMKFKPKLIRFYKMFQCTDTSDLIKSYKFVRNS